MRYSKFIIFLLCLSCSSHSQKSIRQKLEGHWIYEPHALFGDTVIYEITDDFDDFNKYEKVVRKLDSGLFEFNYVNDVLSNVDVYKNLWINEYVFLSDTSGIRYNYELDTTIHYSEHPRVNANSQLFGLSALKNQYELRVYEDSAIYRTTLTFKKQRQVELTNSYSGKWIMKKYDEP